MINAVVVGYGLAGRHFHLPLLRRQPEIAVTGFVARDPQLRKEGEAAEGIKGFALIDEALADPAVDLIVIATPHDSHADLAIKSLQAGKHCVVDKVMALTVAEADAMIAARDASGKMLSVFHNRRWDWDFATVKQLLSDGSLGRPLVLESSVCRYSPPRTWRGKAVAAGTILHDWGAHLIDQALHLGLGQCHRLTAWITPAPWEGVDSGGHGKIVMEFDDVHFQIETSRVCRLDRPRWSILGTAGSFVKFGVDPQEDALRAGNIEAASEPVGHVGLLVTENDGKRIETPVPTIHVSWDGYYANIADTLLGRASLAVTAEQAREVVRVLDAARESSETHQTIAGAWGYAR